MKCSLSVFSQTLHITDTVYVYTGAAPVDAVYVLAHEHWLKAILSTATWRNIWPIGSGPAAVELERRYKFLTKDNLNYCFRLQ